MTRARAHAARAVARIEDGVPRAMVEADVPACLVEQVGDAVARLGDVELAVGEAVRVDLVESEEQRRHRAVAEVAVPVARVLVPAPGVEVTLDAGLP